MSERVGNRDGLTKIAIRLEASASHNHAVENLWAEKVGDGRYRVLNTPFYSYGVSAEDIVFAEPDELGILWFRGTSIRGGHSTYRLLLSDPPSEHMFRTYWNPLAELGCSYEGAGPRLFAVDVPPRADIYAAYGLLQAGEDAGIWEFEEGHCGHPLRI